MDYASTTPLDRTVLAKMLPYFGPEYGNPSSLHQSGRKARAVIEKMRRVVAEVLRSLPEEIIFTGSGTESNNLAILGVARKNRQFGNHIIISAIEHKSILESAELLLNEGLEVSVLPVDKYGLINVEECLNLIKKETILISVMYANNEIGTIEPIKKLADSLKKRRGLKSFPLLHTDACQAAGFLTLDVSWLDVDLMTLNGSKIYGPKGVGILYKKKNVSISPIIVGGNQENKMRAGTESVPLIVGFGEALCKADFLQKIESRRLTLLRDYFLQNLFAKIPNAVLNGHGENRLPNNINVSIPNIEGESILLMLDQLGIEVSTGSACSSNDLKPSHVLLAIGQSPELAHGSIRFSLGRCTTKENLDYVLEVFPKIVRRLNSMSALTINPVREFAPSITPSVHNDKRKSHQPSEGTFSNGVNV